ncbi:MAG TPA: hydrogenase nickel incorporation protein HypB [Stellaceae bacterium]|nr:hydrogenase nickel incorporation protein HypB [Stellaceae bacterium]
MCATCGCESGDEATLLNLQTGRVAELRPIGEHEHVHADGTRHVHSHAPGPPHAHNDHRHDHDRRHHDHVHDHGGAHGHGTTVDIQTRILAKNDALAGHNRAWFAGREILALNLVSSPGSGKTTLLERTIAAMAGERPLSVIEGDQATANDGERIRAAGAPVVQVNTGSGCHLDAEMVRQGLSELRPAPGSILMIENVGNLVCPALFDLGERGKVVIFSVTEGENKPLKYPHMFRAAELVLLNKIDLLPHLDFSVEEAAANVRRINSTAKILEVSARTGAGMPAWLDWIRTEAAASRQFSMT